ncbi:C13 family peptidase [Usitatibacter palustris]|uniref:Peptidase C13 family protein n=1 Tax=Usitatibacter palustris TaxID=2732487 RepID=A0A6M4H373_9PROT|nr:C13 family peptidase [Usitatibacter palustris]QJR13775.1 hypothetical protein DSM104440_00565 [Usitatibacter palustris]
MSSKISAPLADAFRIAFLRRLPADRPTTGWVRILAAAFLTFVPALVYSLAAIGSEGMLQWDNLPDGGYSVFVVFIGAIVLGSLGGRHEAIPTILLAGLLATFAIDSIVLAIFGTIYHAAGEVAAKLFPYGAISSVWLAIAMLRFALSRVPGPTPRGGWMFLAAALFVALPLWYVNFSFSIWDYDYSRKGDDADPAAKAMRATRLAAASEEQIYAQPRILERELAAVEPGRKGVVDVYFIGMAGYGNQDVFMREVDSVAKLMRERFDAGGRIVKLVNNPKTGLTSPIASVTSLRAALKRVAAAMDIEEDVLVLFLTSHGSNTHRFSIELWPFRFNELTPAVLREALDQSGIRNRVVVVSACYSGGFIEPLKSDTTLVMSASSPDRNSFGCSNEAEWTYFGKAYFDEALRKTRSFTEAFDMAKLSVAQREKEEKFEPSDPRMALGKSIGPVLAALERDLASAKRAPAPVVPVESRKRDAYDEYVDLTFDPSTVGELVKTCRHNMYLASPGVGIDRAPDLFGGMNKSSAHWPRLEAAWERYSETYCRRSNDPALLRGTYERQIRALIAPGELAPVVRFLQTPAGKAWIAKEQEALRRQSIELGVAYREIGDDDYRKFLAESDAIVKEHQSRGGK